MESTERSKAMADSSDEVKNSGGPNDGGNELLQGVAKVLWEASAALARLGGTSGLQISLPAGAQKSRRSPSPSRKASNNRQPVDPLGLFPEREQAPAGEEAGAQLANAATALAQAAAALKLGEGGSSAPAAGKGSALVRSVGLSSKRRQRDSSSQEEDDDEPNTTPSEFIEMHGLESWVGEALEMLSPSQCAAVVNPPLNMERARNPNGVVVSRIKQVAPVDQRVQMFIRVNDLAEGVVDRLSTLTSEQLEAVMETGLKIQKATNPSGVAMKRITEVLKRYQARNQRPGLPAHSRSDAGSRRRSPSPGPRRSERSRSRGRGSEAQNSRASIGQDGSKVAMPSDVQQAMEELGLDAWCGEVLRRLSLWQRQTVIREIGTMRSVRNPSGVVMSRIRSIAKTDELLAIFIDINGLDRSVESQLWDLTSEQRAAVMAPGIYVQNVRNPSTAVRSRISNVVEGRGAMQRFSQRDRRSPKSSGREDNRDSRRGRSSERRREDRRSRSRSRKRGRESSSDDDDDTSNEDDDSPPRRRKR